MYKFDLQIRSIQDLFTSKFEAPQNNRDALNTLCEKINRGLHTFIIVFKANNLRQDSRYFPYIPLDRQGEGRVGVSFVRSSVFL